MTFKEFKELEYPDSYDMEHILSDLLFYQRLSFPLIASLYVRSLEKERHKLKSRFNEACINLTQMLGKRHTGKFKEEMLKRAVHTFNLTDTMPKHIHDEDYGYTEEDQKYWDEFTKSLYGIDL